MAATASHVGVAQRLRNLALGPQSPTVRDIIDRYMRDYAGRDTSIGYRLSAGRTLIGNFTLEAVDADLIHDGRSELQSQPALA